MHDIIIVGGGPAGMTAALYALRNGKSALVVERNGFGGSDTDSDAGSGLRAADTSTAGYRR